MFQITEKNLFPALPFDARTQKVTPYNTAQVTLQVRSVNDIPAAQIHEGKHHKLITLVYLVQNARIPVNALLYLQIKKQNNHVNPGNITVLQILQKQISRFQITLIHGNLMLPCIIALRPAYITFHNPVFK
jgi:hypothetical protein